MKIGETARLHIMTIDLLASLDFYTKLGFQRVNESANHGSPILISDGMITLEVERGGAECPSELVYFTTHFNETFTGLERAGVMPEGVRSGERRFCEPGGMPVRVKSANTRKMYKPEGKPRSLCGRFYELSIEVEEVDEAVAFWQPLGFEVEHYASSHATFATLGDGVIRLGVYKRGSCRHKFKNPSLTYFEPDMGERIAKLKTRGVVFLEELPDANGKVENAIAEAPDGQYLFLFQYDW